VLIPYKYLVPLLIFTLLIGVVIGDRLAAEVRNDDDRRSGSCSGLADARLHACVHRRGSWLPSHEKGRTGGVGACGYEGSDREDDD
jgi:hypothetical protein